MTDSRPVVLCDDHEECDRQYADACAEVERLDDENSRLRGAARDLYSIAVAEHGHDETHSADWPSCLPAHMAMNCFRAALGEPTDA